MWNRVLNGLGFHEFLPVLPKSITIVYYGFIIVYTFDLRFRVVKERPHVPNRSIIFGIPLYLVSCLVRGGARHWCNRVLRL